MKNLGIALIIAGGIWAYFAFNASTSISTSYGEVNNIGLIADRQNHLMFSGLTILFGVILFGFGSASLTQLLKPEDNFVCPFCAEDIKLEAKICKHCGKDIPESMIIANQELILRIKNSKEIF